MLKKNFLYAKGDINKGVCDEKNTFLDDVVFLLRGLGR